MEIFSTPSANQEYRAMEELYGQARTRGLHWVAFLDVCFDGGDSVEEASQLLRDRLLDSGDGVAYLDDPNRQ
ncbi:MAG TPA: hypothetical protein VM124_01245 [Candidatus Limnocylindrales bacterium]|nr:hypothetical protein [Candidatus Limnocylindrales bacterium]